jgi:sec-independent protein translocase protein TatB
MTLAGWAEILFIATLAFIIIGPKDLPKVLFMIGRFVQTLRGLSSEFIAEFEAIHHVREVEEKTAQKQSRKRHPHSLRRHPRESGEPGQTTLFEEK